MTSLDEPMTTKEFRKALETLGMTQAEAAHALGVSPRSARGYATNYPIPQGTAILLRKLVEEHARENA